MATAFKNKSTEELTSARDKLDADIVGFTAKLDAAGTKGSMASKKADVGSQLEAHSGLRDKIQKELDAREFEAPSEPQRPAYEALDPSRQWMGLEDPKMAPIPREPPAEVSEVARAAYPPEEPITAGMEGITPEEGTDILRLGAELAASQTPADIPISAGYMAKAVAERDIPGMVLGAMGMIPYIGLPADLMRMIKAGDKSWGTLELAAKTLKSGDIDFNTWDRTKLNYTTPAYDRKMEKFIDSFGNGNPINRITDYGDRDLIHTSIAIKMDNLTDSLLEGTWVREAAEQFVENPKKKVRIGPSMDDILSDPDLEGISQKSREELKEILPWVEWENAREIKTYIFEHVDEFARFADGYAAKLTKSPPVPKTKPAQAAKTAAREADVKGWESPYFSTSRLTSPEDKEFMWYGLHEKWRRAGSKMPPIKTEEQVAEALDQVAHAQRGLPEETMLKLQRSNQFSPAYNGAAENVGDVITRMSRKASHHAPEAWLKPKIHSALSDIHLMEDSIEMQLRENLGQIKESGLTLDQAREEMRRLGQEYADAHRTLPVYNEVQMLANDAAIAFGEWRFDDARVSLQKLLKYVDSEDWYDKLMRVQPGYARPGVKVAQPAKTAAREWAPKTKVVDESGEPMVVYHGTIHEFPIEEVDTLSDMGAHFGTADQAGYRAKVKAEAWGQPGAWKEPEKHGPRVIPVHLNIENPYSMPDMIDDWDTESVARHIADDPDLDWSLWSGGREGLISDASWGDAAPVQEFLRKNGYDGIVYKNRGEGSLKGQDQDSWIVFDANQVKSAI